MSIERNPRVIPPPPQVTELGPMVVVDGECAYFEDKRPTCTAFALPGYLSGDSYQDAMDLGMRRSGSVVYRPLCDNCRRCQPLRIRVDNFSPSKSQKRARRKNKDLFEITVGAPVLDDEHLALYGRYQREQHGENAQASDEDSYQRFLIDTITETIEVSWRDESGALVGVGILDVTPDALSSVYFFWEPSLKHMSLGICSMLVEIELCRSLGKRFYYIGYLVAEAKTMKYKADFSGAELWNGLTWQPLVGRGIESPGVLTQLNQAEKSAALEDAQNFSLAAARTLPVIEQADS